MSLQRHLSAFVAGAVAGLVFFASGSRLDRTTRAMAGESGGACAHQGPLTVVLVALDGVRWQEVFGGTDPDRIADPSEARTAEELVPNLHALVRRGAALGAPGHGAPVYATGPHYVSLPGYREILGGRRPTCTENECTRRESWTLADAFASRSPKGVAVLGSWGSIARIAANDDDAAIVSCGRTGGATRDRFRSIGSLAGVLDAGEQASPAPGGGDYRPDAHTRALALGYLEAERPRFLFVSLGDTDEHAHHDDYAGYLRALGEADHFVGEVTRVTDAWREEGHETLVVVTTDHGRSDDFTGHGGWAPESARVWIVAAGGGIPPLGFVDAPVPRYLRDIAPTVAAVAGVPMEHTEHSGKVLQEILPGCAE